MGLGSAPAVESRLAAGTLAGLLLIAVGLGATLLLAQPEAPDVPTVATVGGLAALTAVGLLAYSRREHPSILPVYAATLLSIALVAALVAASGGSESLYAGLYLFPLVHAAAFQTRTRLMGALALALAAFLAPAVYDHLDRQFAIVAIVTTSPVVLTVLVLHAVAEALRHDHSDVHEREREALRLADEDPLTGLGNYRVFWRQLQSETARVRRHGGTFSLVMIDLDDFKAVNDTLGHREGDRVLQTTARALAAALRAEDLLCRQGGDEFAVIAVQAGAEEVAELGDRLAAAVAAAEHESELARRVTATVGCATFGQDATDAEELVARADEALRRNKRSGRAAATNGSSARARATAPPDGDIEEPAATATTGPAGPGVAHLGVLAGLARALAGATDAHAIALTAVAHLAGAIDGVGASIVRWDRTGRRLEVAAYSGRLVPGSEERRLPDDQGILGIVVREARSIIMAAAHRPAGIVGDPPRDHPATQLAVPIMVGSEVWGALELVSDRDDAYTPDDLSLAEAIADQVGRALACVWVVQRLADSAHGEVDWLTTALEDPHDRSRRVAELAARVGAGLGMTDADRETLRVGALFHDIGSIGVPAGLLHKPGQLTDEERAVMRDHVVHGERLLSRVPRLREAARLVRHAHERVDGSGYPDGLAAAEIPLGSRILLACDAFVAMTSPRPYRAALEHSAALEELRRVAGSQLDSEVVEVLISVVGQPVG